MVKAKIISSLEKVFPDSKLTDFKAVSSMKMLKNQHLAFQVVYYETDPDAPHRRWLLPKVTGPLAEYVNIRTVEWVPSLMPCYPGVCDDNYLRTSPGLYPDILQPLHMNGRIPVTKSPVRSILMEIFTDGEADAGEYTVSLELISDFGIEANTELKVNIIDELLPDTGFLYTQWFHCDCLADWYHVKVFSERHWEIIENFMKSAVECGINTILTPVFTPPLDTYVGGERPTVQLVGVTQIGKDSDMRYEFDYSRLDRWIDMCDRVGIKFFEISHLFTQWGAAHAPKVIADIKPVSRVKRGVKIFGWETKIDGADCAYGRFLRAFLESFISHMKARGDDKRCIFHISDEPNAANIGQYRLSKSLVSDLLEGYTCMDALSNVEYFRQGVVTTPVVANNHIEPFLSEKVPGLWTYYCCGQSVGVSNRFLAMPGARTRMIGAQCFKYDIAGFLHWGFNFYYNQGSYDLVNPFYETTGDYFVPSGDAYSVYPAPDGTAMLSLRAVYFREALEDLAAFRLAEKYFGKDAVLNAIESRCGSISFSSCPHRSYEMLVLRDIVDSMLMNRHSK